MFTRQRRYTRSRLRSNAHLEGKIVLAQLNNRLRLSQQLIFEKRLIFTTVLLASPVVAGLLWHMGPRFLRRLLVSLWPARKYSPYGSPLQEDQYWAAAELYGRRLRSSDARFRGTRTAIENRIPVITSYTPALLPWYRQRRRRKAPEYYLSLRAVCKWHRMVFPGPVSC